MSDVIISFHEGFVIIEQLKLNVVGILGVFQVLVVMDKGEIHVLLVFVFQIT